MYCYFTTTASFFSVVTALLFSLSLAGVMCDWIAEARKKGGEK